MLEYTEVVPGAPAHRSFRLGVAGPVGTGKSSLIATVCRELADELRLGVITNDIYTDEDARLLRSAGVLDPERIRAVETGACPHTAIRDDVTPNLIAVEDEQMVKDAEAARDGKPVLALSRNDPASVTRLKEWVLSMTKVVRSGD